MIKSEPWNGTCKLTDDMRQALYGKTDGAKVKTRRICLIKVLAWNAGTQVKCKDCIYCVNDECTFERSGVINEE